MERKLQAFSAAQPASRLAPLIMRSTTSRPPFVAPDRTRPEHARVDGIRQRSSLREPGVSSALSRLRRQKGVLAAALLFPLALRRGLAVDQ
jgi:hypothetical protein